MALWNLRRYFPRRLCRQSLWRMLLVVSLAIGLLGLSLAGLRARARPLAIPVFRSMAESRVQLLVRETADQIIEKEEYKGICALTYEENGKIAGVWVDSHSANRLVAELTARLRRQLSSVSLSCKMHSGDVIFPKLFSGCGFSFTIRGSLYGGVSAKLVSELVEGGLNQTLHRLEVEVNVPLTMTVLGESAEFTVISRILLGEAVIVGAMPSGVVVGG